MLLPRQHGICVDTGMSMLDDAACFFDAARHELVVDTAAKHFMIFRVKTTTPCRNFWPPSWAYTRKEASEYRRFFHARAPQLEC